MRTPTAAFLFALSIASLPFLAAGCEPAEAPSPAAPPPPPPQPLLPAPKAPVAHGVDVSAMDRGVRPGDDFYAYAVGTWMRSATIRDDQAMSGPIITIIEDVLGRTRQVLEDAAKAGAAQGTDAQRIGDFYASYMDAPRIEAAGIAPLARTLDAIAKLSDKKALAGYLGGAIRADVDPLNDTSFETAHILGLWVEQDLNDPSRAAPYLLQGGLGMPGASYYTDDAAPMKALRQSYLTYVKTLLDLAKVPDSAAKASRVFDLERAIAKVHASRVDSEDVKKANNPWRMEDFAKKAPGMDWKSFFAAASLDKQPSFIVWHPTAVMGISALVKSASLKTWKEYLVVRALDEAAPYLPAAFESARFAFFGTAIRGMRQPRDRWKRAVDATNAALPDAVGKGYVARFFPPKYKEDIQSMASQIIGAFDRRIESLAWMAPDTKEKARAKLRTLRVGVGYPDTWRDDSGLLITHDLLENVREADLYRYKLALAKLGKPADRAEWAMSPQTVNAVNLPVRNALNFPAAYLQPPFYDPEATAAVKFAAMGATIGHEISHSFDDQGAQFDSSGKLTNWWTPADFAHFEASGAALAKQYDGYRPFPDLAVNGKQCLSENIADLAGLMAAYDAWKTSLGGQPAPVVDGLTGDQQFFIAYAQSWQSKMRDELLRAEIATDGHAPGQYRALTVRNLDAWYAAFDVQPKDALYLAPDARVHVW